jgi:EmrB/QacA subfamily drug resistance transporter
VREGDLGAAWRVLALVCAASFVSTLDIAVVVVAFNDIRQSFSNVSRAELSWVITVYTITAAAMLVPSGRLADRIGSGRVFLLGVGLFALGSLLSGLAPNVRVLIGARMVQAVGSAMQTPSSLSLISRFFPAGRRNMAIGLWGATGGLGGATGPSLGAAIVGAGGWRWIFLINVPLGATVVVVGARMLRRADQRQPALPPDLIGALMIIVGVSALSLGLVQSDEWGWSDRRTIGAFVVAVVVLASLLARSAHNPLLSIDLRLFRINSFRWANGVALTLPIAFFLQFFGSVQFLTAVWGYSEVKAGLLLTPVSVLQASLTLQAGRLADRLGHRALLLAGSLIYTVGAIAWFFTLDGARNLVAFYVGATLLAIGVGLTYACFNSAAVHDLPPSQLGAGSGLNQTINRVGATLGIALAVALLAGDESATAFRRLWAVMIGCAIATALFASLIDTRPNRPRAAPR